MPPQSNAHLLVPVTANGLADTVARQLADAIRVGLLVEGEQLPPESVFAVRLGVATVTLREALASLREQGLVETRRGRHGGTFVVGAASLPATRLRSRLRTISVVELRDLGDEWLATTGAAARLAARRASDAEVARLRTFAAALADAATVAERVRANSRFAIELALASQSERLTRAQVRLQSEAGELLWAPTATPLEPGVVAGDLRNVADAVAAEDERRARDLAEERTSANVRWLVEARIELSGEQELDS
jgi:GntR family transcriptional repressor for pyruvate dehydrogenase complex